MLAGAGMGGDRRKIEERESGPRRTGMQGIAKGSSHVLEGKADHGGGYLVKSGHLSRKT